MPFKIVRNDITKVKADVIVNTANPNPICASGTDLAIYFAFRLYAPVTAISPLAILPMFALSARSFSFPAASYIAKSVPQCHLRLSATI